jgi:hypothetical protein
MALSKDLNRRICDYDFEWVEAHLKRKLPAVFKGLFISGKVLALENVIVDEDDLYFCVANWEPQNAARYAQVWPGAENRLILAQDGAGNEYHALPEEDFRAVYFFDHETGETEPVGIDIPQFIKKLEQEYVRGMAEEWGWEIVGA